MTRRRQARRRPCTLGCIKCCELRLIARDARNDVVPRLLRVLGAFLVMPDHPASQWMLGLQWHFCEHSPQWMDDTSTARSAMNWRQPKELIWRPKIAAASLHVNELRPDLHSPKRTEPLDDAVGGAALGNRLGKSRSFPKFRYVRLGPALYCTIVGRLE